MKKKKKGFTLTELIGVIVILALLALIGIPTYNTIRKRTLQTQYENLVKLIETEATKFASQKATNLTNVQELIDGGLLETDDGENVLDPRDKSTMNCHLIEITYDKGNFSSNFIDEKNCNLAEAKAKRSIVTIEAKGLDTGRTDYAENTWIKEGLKLSVKQLNIPEGEEITGYRWVTGSGYNSTESTITVDVNTILKTTANVEVTSTSGFKYFADRTIKIDKEAPIIKGVESSTGNDWNKGRDVMIEATDQSGSGIAGYYVGKEECNSSTVFDESTETKYTKNIASIDLYDPTEYYICVKDKAGNITKYEEEIILEVKDIEVPTCVWKGENTTWTKNPVTITVGCKDNQSGCATSDYSKTYSTTTKTEEISYTIKDKAGNETICSKSVNVYVDKTSPKAPTTMNFVYGDWSVYTNNTWTNRNVYAGRISTSPAPTGATDADSGVLKYQISKDGTTWEDYNYISTDPMYRMTDTGTHIRYFRAVDNAGNVSTSISRTAKIDKVSPTPPTTMNFAFDDWSAYTNNTWTNKNIYVARSSASKGPIGATDAESGILKYQISKDGTTWVDYSYASTNSMYKMSTTGTHTRYFRAVDNAGNVSTSLSRTAKIDKIAPTCSAVYGGSTEWTKNNRTISQYCSDSDSGCEYDVYSKTYDSTTKTATLVTTISDKAGNTTYCSRTVNVYVDKTKPTCGSITGQSTEWTKDTRILYQQCSDSHSGCEKESYSWVYNSTLKTTTLTTTISDAVGNTRSCSSSVNVYVDKTAPTCGSITGESTSWTANNRTLSQYCSDSDSGCKQSSYSKLYDSTTKTATMSTTISDNVGNTRDCSSSVNVYVDKTKPTCGLITGQSTSWTASNRTLYQACSDSDSGCKQSSYSKTYDSTTKTATLSTTISDSVGNTRDCSSSVNVYVDKTAPSVPTVTLKKWSVNTESGRPTTSNYTSLTTYTPGTTSNKKIYTIATGSTDGHSGGVKYYYTTTGATTNVTDYNNNYRSIEAEGTSTIKYKACDAVGNCSAYTTAYNVIIRTTPTVAITGNIGGWVCGSCKTYCVAQQVHLDNSCLLSKDGYYGNTMGKVTYTPSGNKVTFTYEIIQGIETFIAKDYWVKFIIKNSSEELYSTYLKKDDDAIWATGSTHKGTVNYTFNKAGTYYIYIEGNSSNPSFNMNFGTITVTTY